MPSFDRYAIRPAEPRDVDAIVGLIRELAEFERLAHLVKATPEALHRHLFGARPVAEALVVEAVGSDAAPAAGSFGPVASAGPPGPTTRSTPTTPATPSTPTTPTAPPTPVGFALFFTNFSTFLAQPGLYLEDLYVQPAHRGAGVGRALLARLAATAVARDCGRFEWSVLDWNAGAIRFYERMGAKVLPDWRLCRVAGDALQRLGAAGSAPAA